MVVEEEEEEEEDEVVVEEEEEEEEEEQDDDDDEEKEAEEERRGEAGTYPPAEDTAGATEPRPARYHVCGWWTRGRERSTSSKAT